MVEREFQRGRIVLAAPDLLKPYLLDVTSIAAWGAKAVSCCVVANGVGSREIGVARRSVLGPSAGKLAHRVVSETLVAVRDSPLKTFVTFSLSDALVETKAATLQQEQAALIRAASDSTARYEQQQALLHAQRQAPAHMQQALQAQIDKHDQVTQQRQAAHQEQLQQLKRAPAARQRAPHPSDALPGALFMDTTISLSPVDSDPQKTFVEVFVEYAAADAYKAAEIDAFLSDCWVTPLLDSMSDFALNLSFPVQKGPTEAQFRKLYQQHEDTVVQICAKKHVDDELKARAERLLDALYGAYRDTVAAQAQVQHLRGELQSEGLKHEAALKRIATLEHQLFTAEARLLLAEHAAVPVPAPAAAAPSGAPAAETPSAVTPGPGGRAGDTAGGDSEARAVTARALAVPSKPAAAMATASPAPPAASDVVLRPASKAAFTATPEERCRQVTSAIPAFGVTATGAASGSLASGATAEPFDASRAPAKAGISTHGHPVFRLGGAPDSALRAKFDALDVNRLGYLTVDDVAKLLASMNPADEFDVREQLARERQLTPRRARGAEAAAALRAELDNPARTPAQALQYRNAMEWVRRTCADKTGRHVTFDEMAVLLCKLERAI